MIPDIEDISHKHGINTLKHDIYGVFGIMPHIPNMPF